MSQVQITTAGIKKHLRRYSQEQSICEYIWNGFDANASEVKINFKDNGMKMGGFSSMVIKDNGFGISFEDLKNKFKPYFETRKKYNKTISLPHGRNGYGRFSFITFAANATWETRYLKDKKEIKEYSIAIKSDSLENYEPTAIKTTSNTVGTKVLFSSLIEITNSFVEHTLIPYIKKEFGWLFFLYPTKRIVIGDVIIDCNLLERDDIVFDSEEKSIKTSNNVKFNITYVQWKEKIHQEYSRLYYINEKGEEKYKETTKLNNKGDCYYHSLFIRSEYFQNFYFTTNEESQKQESLLDKQEKNRKSKEFQFLDKEIMKYLKEKRKPYVKKLSLKIVKEYEDDGIIFKPDKKTSPMEEFKYDSIKEVVAELYQAEPKIFSNFNEEQKKTFVGLLAAIIQSGTIKDDILKILDKIIKIDDKSRGELAEMLDRVSLKGLLKIAKLIEYRYKKYDEFQQVILEKETKSYEKEVQNLVEENLWIIDEGYNLVAAEEDSFEVALRKLLEFRSGVKEDKPKIIDKDKNKQADIFACRQLNDGEGIQHIIVELKRPKIKINREHWLQIDTYKNVILNESRFNSADAIWKFYLIGNKLDDFIKERKKELIPLGEKDLILINTENNFKVYALTWSQIFDRFIMRHSYLKEKLDDNISKK